MLKACMTLHNFLRQTDNAYYSPQGFVDSESSDGAIKVGQWRTAHLIDSENNCFQKLQAIRGSRYSNKVGMRETLKDYLNSEEGSLPWQFDYVHRTGSFS